MMDCRVKPGNDDRAIEAAVLILFAFHSNAFLAPCDQELVARGFLLVTPCFARRANKGI
jgi:hypothetical protein